MPASPRPGSVMTALRSGAVCVAAGGLILVGLNPAYAISSAGIPAKAMAPTSALVPTATTVSGAESGREVRRGVGRLRGKVRNEKGKPLKGVWVHAFRKKVTPVPGAASMRVRTNARGAYRLDGLPKGKYRVLFDGFGKLRESRWYGGTTDWQSAQFVKVRRNRSVTGVVGGLNRLPVEPPAAVVATTRPAEPAHLLGLAVDGIQPYVGQTECRPDAQPGTLAVRDLIFSTYGPSIAAGLNRACQKDTSEHYDGRAIDWMVNSRDLSQGSAGDAFVNWLTETRDGEPGAMARRLGVMYIIWRGRSWGQYRMETGWRDYQSCQEKPYRKAAHDNICHRNHIHISLNPAGALQQTSWWTGVPLASAPLGY